MTSIAPGTTAGMPGCSASTAATTATRPETAPYHGATHPRKTKLGVTLVDAHLRPPRAATARPARAGARPRAHAARTAPPGTRAPRARAPPRARGTPLPRAPAASSPTIGDSTPRAMRPRQRDGRLGTSCLSASSATRPTILSSWARVGSNFFCEITSVRLRRVPASHMGRVSRPAASELYGVSTMPNCRHTGIISCSSSR